MQKFKFLVLILLAFTFSLHADKDFTPQALLSARESVKEFIVTTPLVPLPTFSKMAAKKIYLKDESCQKGLSFKTRGVTFEVFKTVEEVISKHPEILKKGLQLVTQTDGNHGVALTLAVTSAIEKYSKQYPHLEKEIRKIEPVIFTYKNVLPLKRQTMEKAMSEYRMAAKIEAGKNTQGQIFDEYTDYGDAKKGREKFISEQEGRAIYMEHGGIKTMLGHATASLEIIEQLKALGIRDNEKVCLMLPIGAGGPIGLAAALKTFRPGSSAVMVQTPRWGAFVRSFANGKMEVNDASLSPFTVEVMDNGALKPVIYEDGISVDAPESMEAIARARTYLDDAVLADPKRALKQIAPVLLFDLDTFYKNPSKSIVGGTTAIVADALLFHPTLKAIHEADVVVIFATEGSIDPAVLRTTRALLEKRPF